MAQTLKLIRKKDEITALNGKVIDSLDSNSTADAPSIHAVNEYVGNMSNTNLLINGDFQVWQRGETHSNIANQYTADRWQIKNAKGNTSSVVKSTDVPSGVYFSNSIHITETLSENTYLRYNLEQALKGTLTLSFWYKTDVAFNSYIYDNGSLIHLGKSNATNEWTKCVFTFDATALTYMNIIHSISAGDVYIAGVKLEYGAVATPFVPRSYAEELISCYRFFYAFNARLIMFQYYNEFAEGNIYYPIKMRTTPSISYMTGTYYSYDQSSFVEPATLGINYDDFTADSATIVLTKNAADTFSPGHSLNAKILICFDAEIY